MDKNSENIATENITSKLNTILKKLEDIHTPMESELESEYTTDFLSSVNYDGIMIPEQKIENSTLSIKPEKKYKFV